MVDVVGLIRDDQGRDRLDARRLGLVQPIALLAEVYDFDLEALAPLAEKCGPTWDEVQVPLAEDEFPTKTHTNAFRRL